MLALRMMMGTASGEAAPSTDPALVAYTVASATAEGAFSINVPAGVQDGDLLLFFGAHLNGAMGALPGFTLLRVDDILSTDWMYVQYRRADSEPASYASNARLITSSVYMMVALRNVGDIQASGTATATAAPSVAGTASGAVVAVYASIYYNTSPTAFAGLTGIGSSTGDDYDVMFAAWKALAATEDTGTFAIDSAGTAADIFVTITALPAPPPSYTPTLVGYTSAGGASTTAFNISVPTGVQDGDLLILVTQHLNNDMADPAGWTSRVDDDSGSGENVHILTKVASSEPATYSLDPTLTGGDTGAMMVAFRSIGAFKAVQWVKAGTVQIPTVAGVSGGLVFGAALSGYQAAYWTGAVGMETIGSREHAGDSIKMLLAWKPLTATEATGVFPVKLTGTASQPSYAALSFDPA